MRSYSIFAVFCFFQASLAAAEIDFLWSFRAGGEGNDKIRGITAAEDGGVFVTGEISGQADFGDHLLPSAGSLDFVVAKIDQAGRVLWASRAGGAEIDRGYGVSPTGDGGCFVTGHFQSEAIRFGETELKNAGDYDGFVARYDREGNCLWAKRFGGANYDYGHGIATGPDGQAIVAGAIANRGMIESVPIGTDAGRSAVLTTYSPDGDLRWAKGVTGASASGHNVAAGKDGAIYLCGFVRGKVNWSDTVSTESKVQDICLARFDPDGGFQWVQTAGGESDGLATSVAVDEETGNVLIAGMFKARTRFGKIVQESRGEHDFFMALLSPTGKHLNAHFGGGIETDYALGAAAIPGGGFVITGELSKQGKFAGKSHVTTGERDAYVAVLSGKRGDVRSFTLAGGVDHDLSYAISATTDGAIAISGAFRNATQFGNTKLTAEKGNDIFVAKLKPKGY